MELVTTACRFTLPGRAAAFGGKGGATLVAGGDDGIIKLVSVRDSKVRGCGTQIGAGPGLGVGGGGGRGGGGVGEVPRAPTGLDDAGGSFAAPAHCAARPTKPELPLGPCRSTPAARPPHQTLDWGAPRSSARSRRRPLSAACRSTPRARTWRPRSPTAAWAFGTPAAARRRCASTSPPRWGLGRGGGAGGGWARAALQQQQQQRRRLPAAGSRPGALRDRALPTAPLPPRLRRWTLRPRAAASWRGRPTAASCWQSRGGTRTSCCWSASAGACQDGPDRPGGRARRLWGAKFAGPQARHQRPCPRPRRPTPAPQEARQLPLRRAHRRGQRACLLPQRRVRGDRRPGQAGGGLAGGEGRGCGKDHAG
jgi:hypothetical protein